MKIEMPQLSKTLECEKGQNLFLCLRKQEVAIASSCKGDGICGKCVVSVTAGAENLTPPTELELKLYTKYNLKKPQRISCQCRVQGDIEIKTPYW